MTSPNTRKGTLMVVDDDVDNLELMELSLCGLGYNIITATSMCEAVERYNQCQSDIRAIITDYWLGDGTGVELVEKMGEHAPSIRILTTGHADVEVHRMFDAFLLKPVTPDRMSTLVANLLLHKIG